MAAQRAVDLGDAWRAAEARGDETTPAGSTPDGARRCREVQRSAVDGHGGIVAPGCHTVSGNRVTPPSYGRRHEPDDVVLPGAGAHLRRAAPRRGTDRLRRRRGGRAPRRGRGRRWPSCRPGSAASGCGSARASWRACTGARRSTSHLTTSPGGRPTPPGSSPTRRSSSASTGRARRAPMQLVDEAIGSLADVPGRRGDFVAGLTAAEHADAARQGGGADHEVLPAVPAARRSGAPDARVVGALAPAGVASRRAAGPTWSSAGRTGGRAGG